jgi:hypothetical protein
MKAQEPSAPRRKSLRLSSLLLLFKREKNIETNSFLAFVITSKAKEKTVGIFLPKVNQQAKLVLAFLLCRSSVTLVSLGLRLDFCGRLEYAIHKNEA